MIRAPLAAAIAFVVAFPVASLGTEAASMEARARDFLVLRLKEALALTDGEAAEVRALIHRSEDRRRDLRAERAKIEDEIRKQIGAGESGKGGGAELDRLVAEANRLDEELALLPEKNNRDLQKMLTREQRAKLILFRPRMQEEVRRAIRQRLEAGGAGTPAN